MQGMSWQLAFQSGAYSRCGMALTLHWSRACRFLTLLVCAQHKVGLALKEFRLLHAASMRGAVPMNKLIFPPALKYLPLWSLGETLLLSFAGPLP